MSGCVISNRQVLSRSLPMFGSLFISNIVLSSFNLSTRYHPESRAEMNIALRLQQKNENMVSM